MVPVVMSSFRTVADVVSSRLCVGCGICEPVCPQSRVRIIDRVSDGNRPSVAAGDCGNCTACVDVCPSVATVPESELFSKSLLPEVAGYGIVLEAWEGHAADPEIRDQGSSGGALTALALFALESGRMEAVAHIGQAVKAPFENETFLSRSRSDLLSRVGSRYAPASACSRLKEIESSAKPVAFIGQPSEVSAIRKAMGVRPGLRSKIGVTLSFFCAGSPAMKGTLDIIQRHGVNPNEVDRLRYRGRGWPGHFEVFRRGETESCIKLTYRESWGFVQAYRPLSVHLWPDGTGEDADISCGDPWYTEPKPGDEGSSLVVVRTERGREFLKAAREAGYLQLTPAETWKLERSQEGLIRKRGSVWGRLLALRLLGAPVPKFPGKSLFRSWLKLPLGEKLKSTVGTVRRVISRGWRKPLNIESIPTTQEYLDRLRPSERTANQP